MELPIDPRDHHVGTTGKAGDPVNGGNGPLPVSQCLLWFGVGILFAIGAGMLSAIVSYLLSFVGAFIVGRELLLRHKAISGRLRWLCAGVAARGVIGGAYLALCIHYYPASVIRGPDDFYKAPLAVLAMPEVLHLEVVTNSWYRSIIAGRIGEDVDPFTRRPFRELEGVRYSIGPSLLDERMEIIYDPTNGTMSRGDIPLGSSSTNPDGSSIQ